MDQLANALVDNLVLVIPAGVAIAIVGLVVQLLRARTPRDKS